MEEKTLIEQLLALASIENGLFIVIALLGMLGHAIKKALSGQLRGKVIDYIFFNNKKRTMLAILTTLGAALSLILGEQIPTQAGAYLMLAFTTGYTADSAVNKEDTE